MKKEKNEKVTEETNRKQTYEMGVISDGYCNYQSFIINNLLFIICYLPISWSKSPNDPEFSMLSALSRAWVRERERVRVCVIEGEMEIE